MDALNFLKFWRHATMATTSEPHLVVETDTESDEDDSFFDLELTLHNFDAKENNSNNKNDDDRKETTTTTELKSLCSKHGLGKTDSDVPRKTTLPVSPPEPISKRKVLPIEPISKPQSPIALLRSAPSFRIFMFRKRNRMPQHKTEHDQNKESKVFAVKLNVEDFRSSPALSRDNSTRSFGSKVRSYSYEEQKPERFSKDMLRKYLKLIKPLYVKVSKRYGDKVRFSGEDVAASPSSSPSVASVSSRTEKQGKGMRVVSKHLGKSRSASSTVAGVGSPVNRSDDTLLQQHDGIQSAILHCKRSFNSREGSMYSVRKSFEVEGGAKVKGKGIEGMGGWHRGPGFYWER
ncbi:putative membrane-associated kinase regulator 5, partial [Mucuna pruriens]